MIADIIRKRRSVRTFDGRPLTTDDRAKIEAYIASVGNPFGIPVTFRLLDAAANRLTSPVIVGAEQYVAAKVRREPGFELALGYSFERFCLYAASLGIGTVMLAATLSRDTFETAISVGPDEVMPVASPIGYPAAKKSVRETLMRKGIRADERLPFENVCFKGDFKTPLPASDAGTLREALELTRLAPSAANKQPWRMVVTDGMVHFYECRTMRESPLGDVQKVDMGIALCHFDLALQEQGVAHAFVSADPGIDAPDGMFYVISCELK